VTWDAAERRLSAASFPAVGLPLRMEDEKAIAPITWSVEQWAIKQ
jgi:hypothetical protein